MTPVALNAAPLAAGLSSLATSELLARAQAIRSESRRPNLISYSPKVFIPLTKLCRDSCGYCTFAQPPANVTSPYLSASEVLEIARGGQAVGCTEALFTLGERPELRYPAAQAWLEEHGYSSTIDYLVAMCRLVYTETGLLPHANAGALLRDELLALRSVSPSQGMMLETLRDDLDAHRNAPDKAAVRRLDTLRWAGELQIPFTTGILVGIGETESDRIAALEAIEHSNQQYGHIQEVIVQNFVPKPRTAMRNLPACDLEEYLRAIALARIILAPRIHLQAPPNLSDDFSVLLDAGIDDWGGVSPITVDHVNPERPWPHLDVLEDVTNQHGFELVARLTAYPEYVLDPHKWIDPDLRFAVLEVSDASGYARGRDVASVEPDAMTWYSGADAAPPLLVGHDNTAIVSGEVPELLQSHREGQTLGVEELTRLFEARGREVTAIARYADELRAQVVGDEVTWVSNRNINYTNVCTFKCKFCGFSKGPLSLNLRGKPYLLTLDDIADRSQEAYELGATEVCLQGGIHPDFDGDYYVHVAQAVHERVPQLHIHGFTALEVSEGARRSGETLEQYLTRLQAAGLRTLPGTAAEILDDEVREVLCSDKISSDEWLEVHRVAHRLGLRSNVTIMFGSIETPRSWAKHLVATRALQAETGGFTEFVPLPFVHMAAPIYLQRKARRGPTFREAVLMHAVGRIAYHGYIPNIQGSWVKMGIPAMRQLLQAGVNDLGGTLINENISRAAGATHGQAMTQAGFAEMIEGLDRRLVQRTTLYGRLHSDVTAAGQRGN